MKRKAFRFGECRGEMLLAGKQFLGLGMMFIGDTCVRSARLPLSPMTQTFTGLELAGLEFLGVTREGDGVRIGLRAAFRPQFAKLMRDHSFDPIYDVGDWDAERVAGEGRLDLVLQPSEDEFEGVRFRGFSYHYAYRSDTVPLFYLMDRASWELDGDITGATVVSQSSCSAPVVTLADETEWTTEGIIHWADANSKANPVMTHNLPRWASHQAFDFQCRDDATLLGVFSRVALIRSLLRREADRPELKVFDKHIFDQARQVTTTPKHILFNRDPKTAIGQQNVWTWVFDTVHRRARAEFGLAEEPLMPRVAQNFWLNFTVDSYRKDLLPAAASLGLHAVFIDNMNKSAQTEGCPHRDFHWNMCCGHEYEIAPQLGGVEMLKQFVADCAAHGIRPYAWTNNDQALSSPVNNLERDDKGWFVRLEDTRLKYGGAYAGVMSVLDFGNEAPRRYWVDCLKKIREQSGLCAYLFDSFYNLGFMPINYRDCTPTTIWRGTLAAVKELQDAGVHFMIESFGPFGMVQHGCPRSYNVENLFACYKVGLGTGYTTIPSGQVELPKDPQNPAIYYRVLAYMTDPGHPLFIDQKRIDEVFGAAHRQALRDYHECLPQMYRRIILEDGRGVLWHDAAGRVATLWNFADREAALPGQVLDVSMGTTLPPAARYRLEANHTYRITGATPPPTDA